MGFDPVTMAAAAAGANLVGGMLDRNAAGKAANQANAASEARTQAALNALNPAYQQAGNLRQQALNRSLSLAGQMFMPQVQAMQGGNYAAQQAILNSLPAQRAALLGGRMPTPAQAQNIPFDQNALQAFINPTVPQLSQQINQNAYNQAYADYMSQLQSMNPYAGY